MLIPISLRTRLATQLDVLDSLLDGPDAALAEISPSGGGWSAREIVAHLARHAHVFLERLDRLLREERPNLGTYRPEQDSEWPFWRSLPLPEALRRLRGARADLMTWVDALSDEQAGRAAIHPLLGEMDTAGWLEFFLLHEAHHLYFLLRRLGQARQTRS